jgi:hypothetical protein
VGRPTGTTGYDTPHTTKEAPPVRNDGDRMTASLASWMDRPLSGGSCLLGWIAATAVFFAWVRLFGGPAYVDAVESVYSTWAIAHGHLACAYPPGTPYHFTGVGHPIPFIAPLWPLISGGVTALTQIGHNVPFPSSAALGPHCSTALTAMTRWSARSGALTTTMKVGYLCWFPLMAGVIAVLRASGRGRSRWEPAVLVALACVPCVLMPLLDDFHPQDLLAMGLVLGGVACARRGSWAWAGVLLGLAVTSQQFALLVLAPLLVVAPANRRIRFVGAAIGAAAAIILPMVAVSSGRALGPVLIGSGNTPSVGGPLVWELHLHGALLVGVSRVLPIVLAMVLASWALRRLGPAVLEPVPLLALVATSLSFRLVLEQNLFGYYFMALAVALVLLDVVRGHIRGQLGAWIALVALAFDPAPWKMQLREYLPPVLMLLVLALIVRDALKGRIRWYLVAWFVLVAATFVKFPMTSLPLRHPLPTWLWQVILVPTGLWLAAQPLFSFEGSQASFEQVARESSAP